MFHMIYFSIIDVKAYDLDAEPSIYITLDNIKGKGHMLQVEVKTRYVDGMPTSEVTPFTIRYIRPPHHGHTSQYHGHEWMTHILFLPCQSAAPLLRYSNFRLWPWNSKVKLMGVVKGQCHTVGPVSYQLTSFSFHINQTNNSRDLTL